MFKELDPLLHSQLRLAIMSILLSVEEAEFVYIKEKTNATAGAVSSAVISSPSVERKAGAFCGPGATLMMNSIRRLVPMSRLPLVQKMGITSRFERPIFRPERMSSCVSVPLSK